MSRSLLVAILVGLVFTALSCSVSSASTGSSVGADGHASVAITKRLAELEQQVKTVKAGEGKDAEYFLTTVTIIVGIAAGLITILAVVATVFAYRVVRKYVADEFAVRATAAYEQHGKPTIESGIAELQDKVDVLLERADAELSDALETFRRAGSS
jgi:hypothetical protein